MVGVVVVSHSAKIAEGCKELALQMASDIKIEAAGGMADGGIGTDVNKIYNSILNALEEDGVAILADLGSAVMSSEMAIEMLDETDQSKVKLVDAPLVEAAIAGAVQASVGSKLEEVIAVMEQTKTVNKFYSNN